MESIHHHCFSDIILTVFNFNKHRKKTQQQPFTLHSQIDEESLTVICQKTFSASVPPAPPLRGNPIHSASTPFISSPYSASPTSSGPSTAPPSPSKSLHPPPSPAIPSLASSPSPPSPSSLLLSFLNHLSYSLNPYLLETTLLESLTNSAIFYLQFINSFDLCLLLRTRYYPDSNTALLFLHSVTHPHAPEKPTIHRLNLKNSGLLVMWTKQTKPALELTSILRFNKEKSLSEAAATIISRMISSFSFIPSTLLPDKPVIPSLHQLLTTKLYQPLPKDLNELLSTLFPKLQTTKPYTIEGNSLSKIEEVLSHFQQQISIIEAEINFHHSQLHHLQNLSFPKLPSKSYQTPQKHHQRTEEGEGEGEGEGDGDGDGGTQNAKLHETLDNQKNGKLESTTLTNLEDAKTRLKEHILFLRSCRENYKKAEHLWKTTENMWNAKLKKYLKELTKYETQLTHKAELIPKRLPMIEQLKNYFFKFSLVENINIFLQKVIVLFLFFIVWPLVASSIWDLFKRRILWQLSIIIKAIIQYAQKNL